MLWDFASQIASAVLAVAVGCLAVTKAHSEETGTLTVVAFGTSLTARGGWQEPLRKTLASCLQRPVTMEVVAAPGETSRWGVSKANDVAAHRPNLVLVEFAANDAAIHRFMSISRSRSNLERIIQRIRLIEPSSKIIVMGMNPVHGLRGRMRPLLSSYVAAHRDVAEKAGATFVDHGPAWLVLPEATLKQAIPDGLHPDSTVAAQILVPRLVRILAGPTCAPEPGPAR